MPNLARGVRLVAYLLLGAGIASVVIVVGTRQPVNRSGFVPGAAVSFLAISVAGLGLVVAGLLGAGRYGRVAVLIGLMAWLTVSTYLVVWGLSPGSLRSVPMGTIIAGFLMLGFIGTWFATILVVAVVPLIWWMAWLADLIPALRRRNVGDDIRRQLRPRW